jgi:hypothetical protein
MNEDPRMEFIQTRDLGDLDRAAMAFHRAVQPDLTLVISANSSVCIPGRNTSLARLAQVLRSMADGLEQTHQTLGGRTVSDVMKAGEKVH